MRHIVDMHMADSPATTLLVLLPPAATPIEEYVAQGFIDAVRARSMPIDIMLAEITSQHVMVKTAVATLHEQAIQQAQARGYRHIWLAGISLGAFNALYYASRHAEYLTGLHLISPYPGTGDIVSEIIKAGGPLAWSQACAGNYDDERAWWHWLCQESNAARWSLPVYFGTGNEDRFLRGQRLLADLLPAGRVNFVPGAHNWPAWKTLWENWLDRGPLSRLPHLVTAHA